MRVGYCRVSTKSAEQTASIESQAKRLRDYGCDRVLIDHGISGFRENGRAGSAFPDLIDLILDGTATEVIVPHFDRTQRRVKWGMQLLDALEQAGIKLLELDTGTWLDPAGNPTDVLLAQIRSAVQENESRVKRLKVTRALAAKRAAGLYASGHAPFGYAVTGGEIVQHPVDWPLAQQRWTLLERLGFNGSGYLRVTGEDGTPQGLRAWIRNPVLRGIVPKQPNLKPPALITPEQWAAAQAALAVRRRCRGVTSANTLHLFTGLVMCDACGKNMHTRIEHGRKRLKCVRRQCNRYGQGLRESVVRDAVIHALTARHAALAALAASGPIGAGPTGAGPTAPGPIGPGPNDERTQLLADIERLRDLTHLPGVEAVLAQQLRQLQALTDPASPNGAGSVTPLRIELLDALFRDPATLDGATDEELRAVVIEFIASISWPGGLTTVNISMR